MTEEIANSNKAQTAQDIQDACRFISEFLIEKNNSYGDSALNPTRIFSRLDPIEGLRVRIDDKLNRIKQGLDPFHEDAELDLLGYLILLRVARVRYDRKIKAQEREKSVHV